MRFYLDKVADSDNVNLVPLVNDTDLASIYSALSNDVVGRIVFKSPGTAITYAPFDYLPIRDPTAPPVVQSFVKSQIAKCAVADWQRTSRYVSPKGTFIVLDDETIAFGESARLGPSAICGRTRGSR